ASLEPLPMAVAPALASPAQPSTPLTTSASIPMRLGPALPDAASGRRGFDAPEDKDRPLVLSRSAPDARTGVPPNALGLVLGGLNDSLPYGVLVDEIVRARIG